MAIAIGPMNRLGGALGLIAATAGLSLTSASPTLAQMQLPNMVVQCVAPLVLSKDGTACVRPAEPTRTPDHLTAFSIRAGDGRILGLFSKTGGNTWTGPSLDGGAIVQWSASSDSRELVLYTENPKIRTLLVEDDRTVNSSGLPKGSVLYESVY